METTKQAKENYQSPLFEVFNISSEGCLCVSPGGSEGTGEEPLFAPIDSDFLL